MSQLFLCISIRYFSGIVNQIHYALNKWIKEFLDKILAPKAVVSTVPKTNLVIALPYLGKLSLQIPQELIAYWKINSRTVISDLFSRLTARLITFLHLKVKFHLSHDLALFTNFSVVAAICKTKRHFKVRMCEQLGISALTGKRVKGDDDSAIKEHLLFCNPTPDFEDFSILATNSSDFKATLMESLLISRGHPPLNKSKQSLPLELFDG